jgi:hypothetical protein
MSRLYPDGSLNFTVYEQDHANDVDRAMDEMRTQRILDEEAGCDPGCSAQVIESEAHQ